MGVSSASSARNPCRHVSCIHAGLQSTYPHTAVLLRLQLHQLRFNSKVRLPSSAEDDDIAPSNIRNFKQARESHRSFPLALLLSEIIVVVHRSQISFYFPLQHSPPLGTMPPSTRRATAETRDHQEILAIEAEAYLLTSSHR